MSIFSDNFRTFKLIISDSEQILGILDAHNQLIFGLHIKLPDIRGATLDTRFDKAAEGYKHIKHMASTGSGCRDGGFIIEGLIENWSSFSLNIHQPTCTGSSVILLCN